MKIIRIIATMLTAALLLAAVPQQKKAPYVPPAPPESVTHGTAHVAGQTIPYTVRAGTITLRNDKEQITARMFYTAFTKDRVETTRPVTFFYNGGPGSSTIWLRMGSFAPMRVQTQNSGMIPNAPFKLINNDYSLIDKTDLVFIDAPNTGWSRVIGAGDPKDFMGIDQDGRAFTQFIKRYITQFNRWNSPKFLFGESYGTTRDCVLVDMLQKDGVQMNGVVLLSSILNFGLGGLGGGQQIGGGDWSFVNYLPSEAATAWYYHKAQSGGRPLLAFLNEVEAFAAGQYLRDLALGSDLPRDRFESDVHRLHAYLGISEQYIRDSNLRISYPRFQQALLRNEGTVVGRYDARFNTNTLDRNADAPDWDPSDVGISGAFVGLGMQYMTQTLGYHTNLDYRPTAYGGLLGARWDMHHNGQDPPANVAPDLAEAMTTNPHLRVFSAGGYFDFATPFFATNYTLQHLGLAPSLQRHIHYGYYPSGHMVYLNPHALASFKGDLARWYDDALAGR
ncbi:MAG: peptidase S10 [Candidatus Eremiobacteraeota bacterium]|nr:peptidase S10 [Candidatus Eremiobacteraeota bacterium]